MLPARWFLMQAGFRWPHLTSPSFWGAVSECP